MTRLSVDVHCTVTEYAVQSHAHTLRMQNKATNAVEAAIVMKSSTNVSIGFTVYRTLAKSKHSDRLSKSCPKSNWTK